MFPLFSRLIGEHSSPPPSGPESAISWGFLCQLLPVSTLRVMVMVPKEDTGFPIFEVLFDSPLTVPGEFLEGGELPPSKLLQKIEHAFSGFSVPPPHHVPPAQPIPLPPALLAAKFMFVREDASVLHLPPLFGCLYWVLKKKSFRFQLGVRTDVVSDDRLKPVF